MAYRPPQEVPEYVITHALDDDFDALYHFLFAEHQENLFFRKPEEVRALLQDRVFMIVRRVEDESIVGACYVKSTGGNPEGWELGGIYFHPKSRGLGLVYWMCAAAIVNMYAGALPGGELIAHVRDTNPLPRHLLERLGFVSKGIREEYPVDEISGLRHMTADARRMVYADQFGFPPAKFCELIERIATRPAHVVGKDTVRRTFDIELPWCDERGIELLLTGC